MQRLAETGKLPTSSNEAFPAAEEVTLADLDYPEVREHPAVGTRRLELPCLMLTAEWDPGLRPEFAEPMRALCSDLELQRVEKVGHWVQQEAPGVVNRYLLAWLSRFGR